MNSENNNNIKLCSEEKEKEQVIKVNSIEKTISNIISNSEIITSLFNDHEIINN